MSGCAPLDALLDRAPCGFVTLSADGIILLINATLAGWLDYPPGELAGRRVESILSVGTRVFYQTHVFPLLKMSGKADEIYLVLRSRQGADLPLLVNAVRHERDGAAVYDFVLLPMHQRDRFEDELLQAKKKAEEAGSALAAANQQLQRLDRLKDELLAVTSHDLRSLVATIRMSGQILLDERRAARIDPKRYTRNIVDATDRLMILLNDLSDLTLINTGELRLQLQTILLSDVARAALGELAVRADTKSITMTVESEAEEPSVTADYYRLHQVVTNLIGNAIKFTPTGGTVAIKLRREDDRVALVVQDSGVGIAEELLPQLFVHFKNPSRPGTAGERGSGLGLAIVRRLVELHGGEIVAQSVEGSGSTFTIWLPVAAARIATQARQ